MIPTATYTPCWSCRTSWSTGEVLAIARYSRAAGAPDYVLFDDPEAFAVWPGSLPADTNLLVLKDFQLDTRGAASDVIHQIPNETDVEWLMIVEGGGFQGRNESWECWGTSEVLLRLKDYDRKRVAIVRMPAWNLVVDPHAPDTLSAIVPRADGTTQRGIY